MGQRFRKAPSGETEPYYSFEVNERDMADLMAAVREGKMRSDFITFAIHSHDFRGHAGAGIAASASQRRKHLDTKPQHRGLPARHG